MLHNATGKMIAFIHFIVITSLIYPVDKLKISGHSPAEENIIKSDLTALPPRIILYPFFNQDIEHFVVLLRNPLPIDKAHIRISFINNAIDDAEFFTNNIKWKKINTYYYLTSIYGKPAEIPIVETFFKLDIGYRFKPEQHTKAQMDIVANDVVIKTIPIDFITPFQMEYYIDRAVTLYNRGNKEKIALGIIAAVLFWFILDFFILRKRRRKVPLCSTRARFSTLIEENKVLIIQETKNPFGCRLGGLKKKVKITYKNSNVYVKIGSKKSLFSDKDTISLDINQYWKLRIESQNYFGNDERSHKNLVVLLLPV